MVRDFLREMFHLEVGEGEEHLYRITQTLVADLVDYPNCVAVCYPSVSSHGHHVAVKGPHQGRLRLLSVKLMDTAVAHYSDADQKYDILFRLLRSYDGDLTEDTARPATGEPLP